MVILLQCMILFAQAQDIGKYRTAKLLFKDNFSKELDTVNWKCEIAPAPQSVVYTENGRLIVDTKGGVTVWLNKWLKGNIMITYTRKVLTDGKVNDRLSDLNQFWMAQDPRNQYLFTRKGVFEEYDSLQLYYVGMGGNTNSTTRFRKYEGNGKKPLLQEYTDTAHLLQPDKVYHIKMVVWNGTTAYWVNDVLYFRYEDAMPLTAGYFGFRSTWSRQEITDFKVYQLK
jgi:rhamnogalacturonan endolyase